MTLGSHLFCNQRVDALLRFLDGGLLDTKFHLSFVQRRILIGNLLLTRASRCGVQGAASDSVSIISV
jgi:hypothetical protein